MSRPNNMYASSSMFLLFYVESVPTVHVVRIGCKILQNILLLSLSADSPVQNLRQNNIGSYATPPNPNSFASAPPTLTLQASRHCYINTGSQSPSAQVTTPSLSPSHSLSTRSSHTVTHTHTHTIYLSDPRTSSTMVSDMHAYSSNHTVCCKHTCRSVTLPFVAHVTFFCA
jgi:hypothetical protein